MLCSHCTTELEVGAAYCGECGHRVRARCGTLVGRVIDHRFEIVARIAAGGFGAIYRAVDRHTGSQVALKVLHAELAEDAQLAARFRREGAALLRLTCPHTVETHAVGEAADGTMWIAMELLAGESLLDRVRREGAMPWWRVVAIVRAVCESLAEAHALGIVHRDLKPGNIHLEPRAGMADFVKVLDFGIAKTLRGSSCDLGDELTLAGQAIGTLEYMAPEQLVGTACDGRTDLYTLGVVAYELLAGTRPFADATGPTSLVTALLTRAPAPPSALAQAPVPAALDAIVLRCLARDPEQRFASMRALIDALDALPAWTADADDDGERTWVDAPLVDLGPAVSVGGMQLVDAPVAAWHVLPALAPVSREPPPFDFRARGSTVEAAPIPEVPPLNVVKLLGWAIGLLATGLGIGALLAIAA